MSVFQFPSSGKGRSKKSNSKKGYCPRRKLFQFPSSGKGRSKSLSTVIRTGRRNSFQFPSSGKGRSKPIINFSPQIQGLRMFQFPSSGKGRSKGLCQNATDARFYRGFNSLQAGRGVQREMKSRNRSTKATMFQFPSSGKGRSKKRRRS